MLSFCPFKNGDKLLTLLRQNDHAISIEGLQDAMQLSRRSVLYLIKKVNQALSGYGLPIIQNKKGQGYYLTEQGKHALGSYEPEPVVCNVLTHPQQMRIPLKDLRPEERSKLLNYMLITEPGISLQGFMDIFQVARNTILHELRQLENYNKKAPFQVCVTSRGRIIEGSELAKRRWVGENFDAILQLLEKYYTLSYSPDLPALLQSYEDLVGSSLTDDAHHFMIYFLTWYDQRLISKDRVSLPQAKGDGEEDRIRDWSEAFLARHDIIDKEECRYLCRLMRQQAVTSVSQKDALYDKLHNFADHLASRFASLSGLDITQDRKGLVNRLTVHLISAYHRLQNGIRYHNPMLSKIRQDYQSLFYLTKAAVKSQEYLWHADFSDDEIALIATYFGGAMVARTKATERRRILVVCSSGIGTSQFLLLQLRSRYPQVHFTGPLSTAECLQFPLDDVSLVITTTSRQHFRDIACPVLKVSPLPTAQEWKELHHRLIELDFPIDANLRENVRELIDIISDYAKIEDMDGLLKGLNDYFYRKNHQMKIHSRQSPSDSLLKYAAYCGGEIPAAPHQARPVWQNAIQYACQPLLQGHFIVQSYIDRIIALLSRYGDYMILGKGFLLAHAKAKDGVLASSAALTLFQHPITMQSGKKIRCIICLAPQNQHDHLDFLALLLQKLNDAAWCKTLFTRSSQEELESFIWTSADTNL
ncbi:BglG family transcription antiterminator [Selenomonas sp. WCA-380-WT-3B 3/]|uniref:BglG family transcription antiterminator n=1 Tax=Selenomonas montiformis TaxID=2652285 RepID=A0A6I2UW64_9FIRM|nr:BglG family transcription antiterminator [Selenomonas montiformis]MSV24625.1 BglG family transcription antiterminator [Selenomonas montiformis]